MAQLARVISLEDYRKQLNLEQEAPQPKSTAEQIREDRLGLVEAVSQAFQSVAEDKRKEEILQLLKKAKPSPGMQRLEHRLQSIEEHLLNIQSAICNNGGAE